ncbi:multisubunit sodium/proton antiporter MrpG subunit [Tamaricihabitans halophyticus]|uniref:Multisubunit sodium/proton antiporter MrpG subunit n=1 Tax=Tamaricihabitans halophyticus TaxID=1262583 RepID=A0A4R2R048_9PSEU|nr:monovalent cation/H(+) antiporter subunit G [Tamaricihabitans halophyticus]TCP55347.1 multisubunit sodium/proton antiporter MrpG subunit [Tamaricihabitans halophyticus]
MSILDIASSICLLSGATFCVVGAYGMLRFPDVPSRLQAATKPQTLGLLLVLLGVALQLEFGQALGLALVALLQIITAPVLSQLVGRAAYRTGAIAPNTMVVDELELRLAAEDAGDANGASDNQDR